MFIGMTHAGTMFFFSAVILTGLIWAWFLLPELSGMSLESINAVFELPWYKIGRQGGKVATEDGHESREILEKDKQDVRFVEYRA